MGNKNIGEDYYMGGTKLESTHVEKEFWGIFGQSLSGSSQWAVAVKNVNRMLGYSQEYRSKEVLLTL